MSSTARSSYAAYLIVTHVMVPKQCKLLSAGRLFTSQLLMHNFTLTWRAPSRTIKSSSTNGQRHFQYDCFQYSY